MYLLTVIPYLCIAATYLMVFWPRSVAAGEMARMPGGYDNGNPREQQVRLTGRGARAIAAHQNTLEALPFFGIAVVAAMQRAVDVLVVDVLSLAFVAARLGFVLAYLADRGSLRSGLFSLGALASLILCLCAAFGWPKW